MLEEETSRGWNEHTRRRRPLHDAFFVQKLQTYVYRATKITTKLSFLRTKTMRKVVVKTRTKEVNVFQQGHYFQGQNTKVLDVITRFFCSVAGSIIVVREPSTDKIFTRFLTILLSLYNFTGIAAEAMEK